MKHIYTCILLFLSSVCVFAQDKPEIEGNRNLQKVTNPILATFQAVEIDDELEVTLRQGKKNSYTIETDENLFGVIQFAVRNNVLQIYTTHEIKKSRKIDIELTVSNLQKITLKNDAEVRSRNRLESELLEIYAYNSCKIDIEAEATVFRAFMQHNATGKFKVRSETTELNMGDRTDVNADIRTDRLVLTTTQNAELKLDGTADSGQFTLVDSSKIDAARAKVSEVHVMASRNTDAYIHATKNILISAEGDSTIYVYGNPEVAVEKFADDAKIIKK